MAATTVSGSGAADDGGADDGASTLDIADMQGLVARAFGQLSVARYLLLGVTDAASARRWLASVIDDVSTAADRPDNDTTPCLNVAFTWAGLRALGLSPDALATFPRPLQEGMVTDHRSRILGDDGVNEPGSWRWGGPTKPEIHLVVMLYAADGPALDEEHARRRAAFEADHALEEVSAAIDGAVLDNRGTEHFGFADGLSQPAMKGWPRKTRSVQPAAEPPPPKWTEVNPGEVVLGHEDNFGKPSAGPTVAAATDRGHHLGHPSWVPRGRRHLGQGGTYMVVRQLAQDVAGFRRFVQSGRPADDPDLLAAKLVGRWPSGAPLVLAPEHADPALAGTNDFGYHVDQDGLSCPLGAHIRRSNPRDSSVEHPERARKSNRNHRILRRGRSYGRPLIEPPATPDEAADAERGLVFICLNADIERQFEFVQHTWLGNPYFAGLYGEVDPIMGNRPEGGSFSWPANPVRRQVTGLPTFVTVKGGGYFFLPGIATLRYLAALKPDA
ncbi:MAG: Dyp-type peroxidase [Actinomycetota bacterium]|nr:Dyp-type peroxidase [Actinomycetota bacterium]